MSPANIRQADSTCFIAIWCIIYSAILWPCVMNTRVSTVLPIFKINEVEMISQTIHPSCRLLNLTDFSTTKSSCTALLSAKMSLLFFKTLTLRLVASFRLQTFAQRRPTLRYPFGWYCKIFGRRFTLNVSLDPLILWIFACKLYLFSLISSFLILFFIKHWKQKTHLYWLKSTSH